MANNKKNLQTKNKRNSNAATIVKKLNKFKVTCTLEISLSRKNYSNKKKTREELPDRETYDVCLSFPLILSCDRATPYIRLLLRGKVSAEIRRKNFEPDGCATEERLLAIDRTLASSRRYFVADYSPLVARGLIVLRRSLS